MTAEEIMEMADAMVECGGYLEESSQLACGESLSRRGAFSCHARQKPCARREALRQALEESDRGGSNAQPPA